MAKGRRRYSHTEFEHRGGGGWTRRCRGGELRGQASIGRFTRNVHQDIEERFPAAFFSPVMPETGFVVDACLVDLAAYFAFGLPPSCPSESCSSAYLRTSPVIFIEQNVGPHIEQK